MQVLKHKGYWIIVAKIGNTKRVLNYAYVDKPSDELIAKFESGFECNSVPYKQLGQIYIVVADSGKRYVGVRNS